MPEEENFILSTKAYEASHGGLIDVSRQKIDDKFAAMVALTEKEPVMRLRGAVPCQSSDCGEVTMMALWQMRLTQWSLSPRCWTCLERGGYLVDKSEE